MWFRNHCWGVAITVMVVSYESGGSDSGEL